MNKTIVIGRIVGAHSIHGEIKVRPITDDPARFRDLKYFLAGDRRYEVSSVRMHKENVLISSPDIPDRTAAEALSGSYCEVLREDAVALGEGEFFIEDLKGITIRDISGSPEGTITDIIQSAGTVDVIEYRIGRDKYLMPFLNEYVKLTDPENSIMIADLSKGLKS
ncbi:MAG: 16S rRNA processing protein RimM [Eubacteriaceae bacterium]|nr:16S rRNA processing protein RimM [Eubacteriaceae bacterium]